MNVATVRGLGVGVLVGAVAWAAARLLVGPIASDTHHPLELWGSALFQAGLVCLVTVMWATRATGTSRWGRLVLGIEMLFLAGAIAWTIPYLVDPGRPFEGMLVVLDVFWPLSIAWLIPVGITVARVRRWPSPARWAPLIASLVIPVDLIVSQADEWPRLIVFATYLSLSYGALGILIARDVAPLAYDGPGVPRQDPAPSSGPSGVAIH